MACARLVRMGEHGAGKTVEEGVADGIARSGIASSAARPSPGSGPVFGCVSQAVLAPRAGGFSPISHPNGKIGLAEVQVSKGWKLKWGG